MKQLALGFLVLLAVVASLTFRPEPAERVDRAPTSAPTIVAEETAASQALPPGASAAKEARERIATHDQPVAKSADLDVATIVATVRSPEGEPVESIDVACWLSRDEHGSELFHETDARTNASGEATFRVASGRIARVDVERSARSGPASIDVGHLLSGETYEVDVYVEVPRERLFEVRVVAEEDGRPIQGARARRLRWRSFEPLGPVVATTNEEGFLSFTSSRLDVSGNYVAIEADGRSPVLVSEGAEDELERGEFVVRLPRSARFEGRIFDPAQRSLEVVATASPYYFVESGPFELRGQVVWEWRTTVDENGDYALEVPAGAMLTLTVFAGESVLASQMASLEPGEVRAFDADLGVGARIRGHVLLLDAGVETPLADVDVWCVAEAQVGLFVDSVVPDLVVRTDADGAFEFGPLRSGDWSVGVAHDEDGPSEDSLAPACVSIYVGRGDEEEVFEVTVRTSRGLFLRGEVRDASERPVSVDVDALHLVDGDDETWAFGRSEGDGTFRLGPLIEGEYEITAGGYDEYLQSAPVVARAGAGDVRLGVERGLRVAGAVYRVGSNETTPGRVDLVSEDGLAYRYSKLDEHAFEFVGMPPGRYMLVGSTLDGYAGALSVALGANAEDLRLVLEPAATLRVTLEGDLPEPFLEGLMRVFSLDGMVIAADRGSGEFLLPPGEITVQVMPGWADTVAERARIVLRERTLHVAAGQTVDVWFDLGED